MVLCVSRSSDYLKKKNPLGRILLLEEPSNIINQVDLTDIEYSTEYSTQNHNTHSSQVNMLKHMLGHKQVSTNVKRLKSYKIDPPNIML